MAAQAAQNMKRIIGGSSGVSINQIQNMMAMPAAAQNFSQDNGAAIHVMMAMAVNFTDATQASTMAAGSQFQLN